MKLKNYLLLLFLFPCFSLIAQYTNWEKFSSGKFIREIKSDHENMWVGCSAGLIKVDLITNETVIYNKVNSPYIAPTNVGGASIDFDIDSSLWVGSANGLYHFKDETWSVFDTSNSEITTNFISTIAIDNQGRKYIGQNGFDIFENGNWTHYDTNNSGLLGNSVNHILPTEDGAVWFGINKFSVQESGLSKWENGQWESFNTTTQSVLPYNAYILDLEEDHDGILWVGTSKGIISFDGNDWVTYDEDNGSIPNNNIIDIEITPDGKIVALLKGAGLNSNIIIEFDGTNWSSTNTDQIPNNNLLDEIAFDKNGKFWIGGVNLFNKNPNNVDYQLVYTGDYSIKDNNVGSITQRQDGIYWMSTYSYLHKFDGSNWSSYPLDNFETYGAILEIALDDNEDVWIASNKGVFFFDENEWVRYYPGNSNLLSDNIISLKFSNGKIVVGTSDEGISIFDGTNWQNFSTVNSSILSNELNKMTTDANGIIWISYYNEDLGISKFDGNNWTHFDLVQNGMPNNDVDVLAFDNDNHLWVGLDGANLAKYDGTNWTLTNLSDYGLILHNYLQDIEFDDQNRPWIGSTSGAVFIDGNIAYEYNVFNSGMAGSYVIDLFIDNEGNTWFSSIEGLSVYKDGGVILSQKKILSESQSILNLNVFPNPTSNLINLQYELQESDDVFIEVLDLSGNILTSSFLSNQIIGTHHKKINLEKFNSGIYFIKITTSKSAQVKKVILY